MGSPLRRHVPPPSPPSPPSPSDAQLVYGRNEHPRYWCLLLKNSVGATDAGDHKAAIHSVKMQGGVFGWVSDTDHLHEGLKEATLVA
jgi:hypothetical protein